MLVFKIKHWNSIFENNRSREIRNPSWVAMPNRHDTLGFRTLISRPNGVALYGAWCILVQVASRCNPHGTLVCNNGLPYTARSLSLKTGLSETLISECFDVLREPEIDWLETQEGAALPKNRGAVLMAKRRWRGIAKSERSSIMRAVRQAREDKRNAKQTSA